MSDIIPEGILYGNLGVGSGTTNYNDLDNKPQINSVTLQGNKTASELGLVGVSDIPVTSVNSETGAVVLDGTDIEFSEGVSLNEKIIAVEQEIPVIAYPVTSVNGETGAVVLDGTDIEYSSGVSVNSQIDTLMQYIPVYGNTASGAIATFDTSLALPLQDCTIGINTSTGVSGANVNVCGKNLFDKTQTLDTGNIADDGSIGTVANYVHTGYIKVNPNTSYVTSGDVTSGNARNAIACYDSNKNFLTRLMPDNSGGWTFTTPNNTAFIRMNFGGAAKNPNTIQLEQGTTATTYSAFSDDKTIVSWSDLGTVTDGSLDVTTGKLTVTTGSMASGIYQITPHPINTRTGTNNIFCDTGNTSVVYACSLKDYIDSQ